jgi:glycosyltransferase involved in cell wall biosynthesis
VEIVGSSDLHDVGELSAYERDLRAAARPLGERCTFRPFVDRHGIPDVYRQADIVAMPADWDDPCPLVLLEAMASGAAVVASARGGIREIGGDAVRYVDPRDRHAFATALAELVRDDGARRRLASRAREAAEQQSWRKAAEKLLDVCGA